ncbi:EthD domain-containing protein [Cladophialophora immunda]|nr:EthD domain-containing protein [Cladophialophora immunda]
MASTRIAIAGFTGRVAQYIASHLLQRSNNVQVIGICRDPSKLPATIAKHPQVETWRADFADRITIEKALHNVSTCVCCYRGDADVVNSGQRVLIDACISQNVQRYFASDFSFDYRPLKMGEFPFKDFQLQIDDYLKEKEKEGSNLKAVHILNGGFMEAILTQFMGVLDVDSTKIRYWGTGDEPWDMTSTEDTARFTAEVICDESATGVLKVRGDSKSAKEMADVLEKEYGVRFTLENLGSLDDLYQKMVSARQANPKEPWKWLGMHYNYFTINGSTLLGDAPYIITPLQISLTTFLIITTNSMASGQEEHLCLTITIYRKPGMEPQEFVDHMHKVHAVICADLMEEYGIVEYTQTHISPETRAGIREFFPDPTFAPFSDFDAVVQITFKRLEDFVRYRHDKYFEEVIMPDHANFADIGRTT